MMEEYKLKPKSEKAKMLHEKSMQAAKVRRAMNLQQERDREMMKSGAKPYDVVGYNSPQMKEHEHPYWNKKD